MATLGDTILQKFSDNSAFQFYCKVCDYSTSKKCNYDTHNLSNKHKRVTEDYIREQNSAKNQPKISQHFLSTDKEKFICSCGKEYQHRQGLWRHNKVCNIKESAENNKKSDEPIDKELLMALIKENMDLKKIILEIVKKDTYNINDFEKV
jgi:hypothetical protein